ncbi:MAG: phenylacetate-CoA oxygenase subunit PaaJ [Gemmatimonadaceae bacterium]|nr:phenylacetate-CoA oxygenase subunit PaaJ [Gemmatimonadaceae bacterium]
MVSATPTRERVLAILDTVKDPEIPVISVVELGVVRDVECGPDGVTVVITPTYSGCPAMKAMEDDIIAALDAEGIGGARVRTVFAPAWTTDWIPDGAREKLRAWGIAPPGAAHDDPPVQLRRAGRVRCPFCGAGDTTLRSEFGSTACKATHYCNSCAQPFEEFKAI